MPNWCYTQYAITGGRREIQDLYEKMKKLQEKDTPLVTNGFGATWLGCLVKSLKRNPDKIYCRGQWSGLSLSEDGTLRFDTEHAWSRPTEVEELLQELYPSLSIYFIEEELGMDIFQTNDVSGQFFPETVILDDEESGMEYFTEEGALARISELKGLPVTDWVQAEDFLDRYNAAQDAAGTDRRIWLHRAKIC